MTLRCAACGRRLPGLLPSTSWCSECRTLSCNMCRSSDYHHCPVCGTERHGKDYFRIFFAVSLTMLLVNMILSGTAAIDLSRQIPAEAMPTSDIGGLHPGEHVKIEGLLEGNGTIAIDGAMVDNEWKTTTKSVKMRSLNDNMSILLEMSHGSDISRGPHRSEKPQDSGHSVYWTNDTIVAVGTTARNETNDTVLRVELLRPCNGTFVNLNSG